MKNLINLDLGWNKIKTIENLDSFAKLRCLSCEYNNISQISNLSSLKNLKLINIEGNPIDIRKFNKELKKIIKEKKLQFI